MKAKIVAMHDPANERAKVAGAVVRAAEARGFDPLRLADDLDQALRWRMIERGLVAVGDVPAELLDPILQASWFEALSQQAPSMADGDLQQLVDEMLGAIRQAVSRGEAR